MQKTVIFPIRGRKSRRPVLAQLITGTMIEENKAEKTARISTPGGVFEGKTVSQAHMTALRKRAKQDLEKQRRRAAKKEVERLLAEQGDTRYSQSGV